MFYYTQLHLEHLRIFCVLSQLSLSPDRHVWDKWDIALQTITNKHYQNTTRRELFLSKFSCPQTDKSPISSDESMTNYILLNNWLMIDVQIWIFPGPVTTTSLILPERQAGSVMTREAEVTARPGQRCQYIEDEGPEWRSLDYLLEVTGRQSSQPSSARGEQELFFLRQRKMTLTKHRIFFSWHHFHCSLDLVLPCSSGTWLLTCRAVNILYSLTGISFRSASRLPPSVSSSSNMTGTSTVPRMVWQLRWHFGKRIMFTFLYRK